MPALPYMQLYVAEYLADTAHLTAAQHGAYMLLLMNYWQRGKALPAIDERLAIIARMTPAEWGIAKGTLAEFFVVSDSEWRHKRVETDLLMVADTVVQAVQAGKASARQRAFYKRSADVERALNDRSTNTTEHNRTQQNIKTPLTPQGGTIASRRRGPKPEATVGMARPGSSEEYERRIQQEEFERQEVLTFWRDMRARDPASYEKRVDSWARKILDEEDRKAKVA